jgi:hypothetical protein
MVGLEAGTGASTGAGTVARERVEIVTRGERRRSYTLEERVEHLTVQQLISKRCFRALLAGA